MNFGCYHKFAAAATTTTHTNVHFVGMCVCGREFVVCIAWIEATTCILYNIRDFTYIQAILIIILKYSIIIIIILIMLEQIC